MKQNSSIMFHGRVKYLKHKSLLYWKNAFFAAACSFLAALATINARAAEPSAHPASFDPAKGFKPAQSDLTDVFLQIAGSLEFYGSPEPYLRHMKAEHARIETKYQKQLGDKQRSFCPAYMDAAYFDRFAANWKHIAPQLGLELLMKNTGRLMRTAINGSAGKGTILVDVFNEHQHRVYTAMASKKAVRALEFDSLRASMVKCLRLEETSAHAESLTAEQRAVVNPAKEIRVAFLKLFSALDAGLAPAEAEKVKTVILGMITDVGRMAESELYAGILDKSLNEVDAPNSPYTAERETALNTEERKIFAGFLQKSRFTKADFPVLEKFYSGPYDKLSERGKDEMSHRFWDGIGRPR